MPRPSSRVLSHSGNPRRSIRIPHEAPLSELFKNGTQSKPAFHNHVHIVDSPHTSLIHNKFRGLILQLLLAGALVILSTPLFDNFFFLSVGIYHGQQLGYRRNERRAIVFF